MNVVIAAFQYTRNDLDLENVAFQQFKDLDWTKKKKQVDKY